jgi:preprotein translocase subunit SecA
MTVDCIDNFINHPPKEAKAAHNADITGGTNNEFGFDSPSRY